jgi:hypothetical protein
MADKIPNPFEYSKDPELNLIFDKLIALQARVADKFAKAEKIAGLANATGFVKLHEVTFALPNYRYLRSESNWSKTKLEVIDQKVQAAVAEAKKKIEEVEALNAPLVEQNKALVAQVTEMMTRLGIPSSYTTYEYPSSRSKTKKTVYHSAGYLGDLQRNNPTPNTVSKKYELENYIRDYDRWVQSEKDAENKEKVARDESIVQTKILGNPALVGVLMQAGVNILEEVQKAVPGAKADVIDYCVAKAIQNVENQAEPDKELLRKLEQYVL